MAKLTIVNFIQNQRNKGISDEKIRNELLDKGWALNDVNDGFREAKQNKVHESTTEEEDEWNQSSEIAKDDYDVSSYFVPPKPDEHPGEYDTEIPSDKSKPRQTVRVESVFLSEEQEKKISDKLSGITNAKISSSSPNDHKSSNKIDIDNNELTPAQEEILEKTISSITTAGGFPEKSISKTEMKYSLPMIPLFFFGGFLGAIMAVGGVMRITAIMKNPDIEEHEKRSKVIQTYIIVYSIGLMIFAVISGGGILAFISDFFGISF